MMLKNTIISEELNLLSNRVIGAAIEVHKTLGPGLLESLYEDALAVEFDLRNIPYEKQKAIKVSYKGRAIGDQRLDFLVGKELIVELKSVEMMLPIFNAQVITYLKVTNLHLALLINFNVKVLRTSIQRIIF